jgi:hypothetical protein
LQKKDLVLLSYLALLRKGIWQNEKKIGFLAKRKEWQIKIALGYFPFIQTQRFIPRRYDYWRSKRNQD